MYMDKIVFTDEDAELLQKVGMDSDEVNALAQIKLGGEEE